VRLFDFRELCGANEQNSRVCAPCVNLCEFDAVILCLRCVFVVIHVARSSMSRSVSVDAVPTEYSPMCRRAEEAPVFRKLEEEPLFRSVAVTEPAHGTNLLSCTCCAAHAFLGVPVPH